MNENFDKVKRLEAEVARLQREIRQLNTQFAITHHLVVALAHQCNSPEILRSNFNEIADAGRDRMLDSDATDAEIDELAKIQALVDRQLP